MSDDAELSAFLAAGDYAAAAQHQLARGRVHEAQLLYERVWNFGAAAQMARTRGDLPDLLRLLLEARELSEAAKVGLMLRDESVSAADRERAAATYERRQMWPEAAHLREQLGQLEAAHALYLKGARRLDAARIDEAQGRARQAGQLYERFLQDEPDTVDAVEARLRLAKILGRFGKHDEAVRHLQRGLLLLCPNGSIPPPERQRAATDLRGQLITSLLALGYDEAASHAVNALREMWPEAPPRETWRVQAEPQLLGGRYRLQELIGGGGMGRVYRAVDELSGQAVALKLVARSSSEQAHDGPGEGYRRFVREAQIVAALRHPHIVRLLAVDEALGMLVMELMAGGTLEERLAKSTLSLGAVTALALQLTGALEVAHARGVIHRDVKPSNIFFTATGEAKLGDFGVAHLQAFGATQTAGFIGTLAFMSPEQISGAPLSYAADLYGLGVTLFVALTGRLPFVGPDFVSAHLGEAPPSPSSVSPRAAPFDALVLRLLAKAPTDRFEDLGQLRRALMAIKEALREAVPVGDSASSEPTPTPAPDAGRDRYVITAPIASSARSELYYATDRVLGRPVVLERFPPGFFNDAAGARYLSWLRGAAQMSEGLQRVLAFERGSDGSGQVVFEAMVGEVLAPTRTQSARVELSAAGWDAADGSFVEEEGRATLLLAGFGPRS